MLCNTVTGFPIFDAGECESDPKTFVISGGGGAAKSGIANQISVCRLGPRPDGHKGVSVKQLNTFKTGDVIPDHCCFVRKDLVALALDSKDIVLLRVDPNQQGEDTLLETTRYNNPNKVATLRSYGGNMLVMGTTEGQIVLLEVGNDGSSLTPVHSFSFHTKEIEDLAFAPKLGLMASASADSIVRVWNLAQRTPESIIPSDVANNLTCRRIKFNLKDPFIVKLYSLQVPKNRRGGSFLAVWERLVKSQSKTKEENWTLTQLEQVAPVLVTEFAICRDMDLIAIGAADSSVSLLNEHTLQPLRRMQKVNGFPASGLFFIEDWTVSTAADATCAMIEARDLVTFNIFSYIKSLIKLLVLALVFIALLVIMLVGRGVTGTEAREDGVAESLLSSKRPFDFANLDPDRLSKFVLDYIQ